MKAERAGVICHPMQLQEVLVAMCLAAVLAGLALELASRCWAYCRDATLLATTTRETQILREAWRHFVHECPDGVRLDPDGAMTAGTWRAAVGRNEFILKQGETIRRLRLPRGMKAAIRREGTPGDIERWVLTLAWEGRRKGKEDACRARLVACRPEKA